MLNGGQPSPASDVFAFGIVLFELLTRTEPYEAQRRNMGGELSSVFHAVAEFDLRPQFPEDATVPKELKEVSHDCWIRNALRRPTFAEIVAALEGVAGALGESMRALSSSAQQAAKPEQPAKSLLDSVFPAHVAEALMAGKKVEPEPFEEVTIFFSDIVGARRCGRRDPPELFLHPARRGGCSSFCLSQPPPPPSVAQASRISPQSSHRTRSWTCW